MAIEAPTKPGWYFWAGEGAARSEPEIVKIVDRDTEFGGKLLLVYRMGIGPETLTEFIDHYGASLWQGPLKPNTVAVP